MNVDYEIQKIWDKLNNLENSFIQAQRNNVLVVGKVDDNLNKVNAITPYTETKTAYYGEKDKSFYDVPYGRMSVYFTNYDGDYSVSRMSGRLTISFDALTEQTDITISIQ